MENENRTWKDLLFLWSDKLTSGKFVLTVITSIGFYFIVKIVMDILLLKVDEIEANQIILLLTNISLVIQNVFNSYFNKKNDV